tara:strand:+ start:315 stop:614 length:300 start_codon:yes stop_codon:yes gene_type:complete
MNFTYEAFNRDYPQDIYLVYGKDFYPVHLGLCKEPSRIHYILPEEDKDCVMDYAGKCFDITSHIIAKGITKTQLKKFVGLTMIEDVKEYIDRCDNEMDN